VTAHFDTLFGKAGGKTQKLFVTLQTYTPKLYETEEGICYAGRFRCAF
jgi:hypothetical protein